MGIAAMVFSPARLERLTAAASPVLGDLLMRSCLSPFASSRKPSETVALTDQALFRLPVAQRPGFDPHHAGDIATDVEAGSPRPAALHRRQRLRRWSLRIPSWIGVGSCSVLDADTQLAAIYAEPATERCHKVGSLPGVMTWTSTRLTDHGEQVGKGLIEGHRSAVCTGPCYLRLFPQPGGFEGALALLEPFQADGPPVAE
jgi:hypothetical protein